MNFKLLLILLNATILNAQELEICLPQYPVRDSNLYFLINEELKSSLNEADSDSLIYPVLTVSRRNPCHHNLKIPDCPSDTIFYKLEYKKISFGLFWLNATIGHTKVNDTDIILILYVFNGFTKPNSQISLSFMPPSTNDLLFYKNSDKYCWTFYSVDGNYYQE